MTGSGAGDDRKRRPDTIVWLIVAFRVLGPYLAALIGVVLLAYGLVHLLFFR